MVISTLKTYYLPLRGFGRTPVFVTQLQRLKICQKSVLFLTSMGSVAFLVSFITLKKGLPPP